MSILCMSGCLHLPTAVSDNHRGTQDLSPEPTTELSVCPHYLHSNLGGLALSSPILEMRTQALERAALAEVT